MYKCLWVNKHRRHWRKYYDSDSSLNICQDYFYNSISVINLPLGNIGIEPVWARNLTLFPCFLKKWKDFGRWGRQFICNRRSHSYYSVLNICRTIVPRFPVCAVRDTSLTLQLLFMTSNLNLENRKPFLELKHKCIIEDGEI